MRAKGVRSAACAAALAAGLTMAGSAAAALGDLDPTFSGNGIVLGTSTETTNGMGVAALSDGSIAVADNGAVDRFTADGTPVAGFSGRAGDALADLGPDPTVVDLAAGPDDTVLVVVLTGRPATEGTLVRLLSDGSRDGSFHAQGAAAGMYGTAGHVNVGAGHIALAVGERLFRLLPDGSPDPAFSSGHVDTGDDITGLATRPDGTIVVMHLLKLEQYGRDGLRDPSYGEEYVSEPFTGSYRHGLVLDSTGAGYSVSEERNDTSMYPTCGSELTKFDAAGILTGDPPGERFSRQDCASTSFIEVDDQDRLLFAASDSHGSLLVTRLLPDGSPDQAFGSSGTAAVFPGGCNALESDITEDTSGRILIAVSACSRNGAIRMLTGPGPADLDADGFGDRVDRCPSRPADRHAGCPSSNSRLIARLKDGLVHGRLRARDPRPDELGRVPPPAVYVPACASRRKVRLVRLDGRRRTVESARTDHSGRWSFGPIKPSRKLVVVAPPNPADGAFCLRAEAKVPRAAGR